MGQLISCVPFRRDRTFQAVLDATHATVKKPPARLQEDVWHKFAKAMLYSWCCCTKAIPKARAGEPTTKPYREALPLRDGDDWMELGSPARAVPLPGHQCVIRVR